MDEHVTSRGAAPAGDRAEPTGAADAPATLAGLFSSAAARQYLGEEVTQAHHMPPRAHVPGFAPYRPLLASLVRRDASGAGAAARPAW